MRGGDVDAAWTDYRGSDRRQRTPRPQRVLRRDEVLGVAAALALCAVLLPLGLMSMATASAQHAQDALRNIWSIMFLAGGVLHLVRWRVTGETRAGIRGAGTVCLGIFTSPTAAIGPLLSPSLTTAALSPLTRTVAVVACLSLLSRAVHAPPIDTRARPLRLLVKTLVGGWLFIALMLVLARHNDPVDFGNHVWFGLESAMTFAWLLCAAAAAWQARAEHNVSIGWLATAATMLAAAEMCRGLAFVVDPRLAYFSTGIQLVAATVVLVNAATELTVLLSAESRLLHMLSGTVRDTERQLSADEQADAKHRHDARAVLAALRTASMVLDRYDESLDQHTRADLLGSFSTELQRLEQMIDRRTDAPLETFALDSVVGPAVRSVHDAVVVGDLPAFRVQGRSMELRGLVENVLTTLTRQSIDGQARLRVTRSTSGVQVICEATGPVADVRPGRDADDVSVRNLRLQVARRLLREQGGDVVVSEGWDGKMSVALWLKQAPNAPQSDPAETRESDVAPRRLKAVPLGRAS